MDDKIVSKTSSHVHFTGPWTSAQKQALHAATQAFDRNVETPDNFPFGKPWVAVRHDLDNGPVMLLSRLGVPRAFRASSIDDLVGALNAYAAENATSSRTDP